MEEFHYDKFFFYFLQLIVPLILIFIGFWIWSRKINSPTDSNNFLKNRSTLSLLGREKETKRLVSKIITGQSAAIIGIFAQERSELLNSLRDPNLYGREAENLIFSYIDISGLEVNCTQEQFWKKALQPLGEKLSPINNPNRQVANAYWQCQQKDFNQDCLDKFFEEVKQANLRLVLLLDRFHNIIHKSNLNKDSFLAKLRSLSASSNPSPLCLVITAHESLRKLHEEIMEQMSHSTSPFFNFMDVGEITLGTLSDIKLKKLKLSEEAQRFIKKKVGQHPYLIRIFYNRLKEAEQAQETNSMDVTKQDFKQKCKELLDDNMLRTWSSKMCQVFVLIAQGNFNNLNDDYEAELEELEKQGLIQPLENDQWQVFSPVFVELLKELDISKLCKEKIK